jgi:hypothetical protein
MTFINMRMKIKLLIILLLVTFSVSGQSYDKRLLIFINPVIGKTVGSTEMIYKNAVFPKLFTNMGLSVGGKMSFIYLLRKQFGAGIMLGSTYQKNWSYGYLEYYNSSTASVNFVSAQIYLQTDEILFRGLKVFGRLGPVLTSVNVKLKDQVFFIENNTGKPLTKILSSKSPGVGFDLSGGVNYKLNETCGINISLSYDYYKTESVLYPDTNLNFCSIEAGVILKLFKNKKYYY